jgi:hypothetical protein
MAERDLSVCGDEDETGGRFPGVLTLTSMMAGEGGAAVSGMGQLQGVGPKIVLAQGTHSTPQQRQPNGRKQSRMAGAEKGMKGK